MLVRRRGRRQARAAVSEYVLLPYSPQLQVWLSALERGGCVAGTRRKVILSASVLAVRVCEGRWGEGNRKAGHAIAVGNRGPQRSPDLQRQ